LTYFNNPAFAADRRVAPQANNTTETELNGIRTAQITGDNMPAAPMLIPTALYKAEMPKTQANDLHREPASPSIASNRPTPAAGMMMSLAGEKDPVCSTTATPTSLCFNAPASFKPSPTISTVLPRAANNAQTQALDGLLVEVKPSLKCAANTGRSRSESPLSRVVLLP